MDDLLRIPSGLARLWKSFFGLYTQYMGYMTPDMVRTILQTKRDFDSSQGASFTGMNVSQLNEYAGKHGLPELPDQEELDDVLPRIWDYLKKYDLSESAVPSESWNKLMEHIDLCETKGRIFFRASGG